MIASGRAATTAARVALASSASSTIGSAPSARRCSALPAERELPITSCPRSRSWGTSRVPIAPLAPTTRTRMTDPSPFGVLACTVVCRRERLGRVHPGLQRVSSSHPSCVVGHFYDTWQRKDVTDGRERVAGGALRRAQGGLLSAGTLTGAAGGRARHGQAGPATDRARPPPSQRADTAHAVLPDPGHRRDASRRSCAAETGSMLPVSAAHCCLPYACRC